MITISTLAEYDSKYPQLYMRMFDDENMETYKEGYVVSGYRGKDSHHYFATYQQAKEFADLHA